ncbi:MbtH family protein [Nonomuraea fuscirosea]|uniref:MbtH protein n=1 Tax=Nonomuraea fuscirosea TaxID=1291556 RepID=A0A2T0MQK7_9ACTN|nr:MbtH family NRPS accessory protein [Nonomuraea fuscirosea]PRX60377.1 MbtH protein [Nonomuraea fuscirosea]
MNDTQDDEQQYLVVVNDEEQYSIWRVGAEVPAGWHADGTRGTRAECLAHIDEVWTDMRPLSLRRAMEEAAPLDETQGRHDGLVR